MPNPRPFTPPDTLTLLRPESMVNIVAKPGLLEVHPPGGAFCFHGGPSPAVYCEVTRPLMAGPLNCP